MSLSAIGNIRAIVKELGDVGGGALTNGVGDALAKLSPELQQVALKYSGLSEAAMTAALSSAGFADDLAASTAKSIAAQSATLSLGGAFQNLGTKIATAGKGLLTFLTTNPAG